MKPQERTFLIDGFLSSLDEADRSLDDICHAEIEKRVEALQAGHLKTIPYNEFK